MILKLSFIDYSIYGIIERLFINTAKIYDIDTFIQKQNNQIDLFAKCDDSERLASFADEFSFRLPYSLFITHKEVKIVKKLPTNSFKLVKKEKVKLPYCPKCLKDATQKDSEDYYNIFKECDICGYRLKKQPISLSRYFKNSYDYEAVIKKVALLISMGSKVKVKTFNGDYLLSKLKSGFSGELLCYDLDTISKYSKATEKELLALASIEKPAIKLQTNLTFKCDFEGVDIDNAYYRLPNDLLLYFITKELANKDIKVISISKEFSESDYTLDFDSNVEDKSSIRAVVSDKNVLITKDNPNISKKIKEQLNTLSDYEFAFSVAKEYDILDKKAVCAIYLSKKYSSKVMFYSKKIGFIEHLPLTYKITSIEELLKDVENQNESSKKLITKYKKQYQSLYESIKDISFEKELNLYEFWKVVAKIVNIGDIEENCFNFLDKKGPRVDYKLMQNSEKKSVLNPLKTVQSAISFKLAGIDNMTLSYGIMESFVDFISSFIDDMKLDMNAEVVTINGSMLELAPFFSKLDRAISKNHKLIFNKRFPIDKD
jgi:hemerythrin-like domain-containing protein